MQLLVDADLLVYRCGFAAEGEPVENALHNVNRAVNAIQHALLANDDDVTMCLSGPTNFRTEIATIKPYKGNRDPNHKPEHGPAIKEYIKSKWECVVTEDEEADDWLGYTQFNAREQEDTCIVSIDKDLDMIPGYHYNFLKERQYFVNEDQADYNFWHQMLTGDSTDNIPGVPGIGPKKADRALENSWVYVDYNGRYVYFPDVSRKYVVQAYKDHYGKDYKDAVRENAALLWIRREPGEEIWRVDEFLFGEQT